MAGRDIIVVGASAGGVEALRAFVQGLPADLPAAVFVVLHTSPRSTSRLPQLLGRRSRLAVAHGVDGEAIAPGRIYIAPPDRHMEVRDSRVKVHSGPRENRTRPAVDPLFRSAAETYGSRVVGVLLSGFLDDGVAGLEAIKRQGGLAIVQDPDEALVSEMPRRAMASVEVDHILKVGKIGALLARLAAEPFQQEEASMSSNTTERSKVIQRDLDAQADNQRPNMLTSYVCPECGGTLWQINEGHIAQFYCHVGHKYSLELMVFQKSEQVEAALWSCVRLLTEKAVLTRQVASRVRADGDEVKAGEIERLAELDEKAINLLRDQILMVNPTPIGQGTMLVDYLMEVSKRKQAR